MLNERPTTLIAIRGPSFLHIDHSSGGIEHNPKVLPICISNTAVKHWKARKVMGTSI